MFNKQTCFVLGAGASCPYGYPLGKGLIDAILRDMEDEVYLFAPTSQSTIEECFGFLTETLRTEPSKIDLSLKQIIGRNVSGKLRQISY